MKLLNYDQRTLILQNLRPVKRSIPDKYTKAQYRILCQLIRRKHISEKFFNLLLFSLYELQDWKKLNYEQMYELIFVLSHYDFEKVRTNYE